MWIGSRSALVQTALLGGLLPPPTSGAGVFAFEDGTGAGGASNGRKALAVQGVGRDAVGVDVGVQFLVGPIHNGVELDETRHSVALETGEGGAVVALGCTQPSDPHRSSFQRTLEGIDFSDAAARFSGVEAPKDGRHALFVHELLQRGGVREVGGEVEVAVFAPCPVDQVVRFREEASGVEGHESNRKVVPRDEVGQRLVLQAQGSREDHLLGVLVAQLTQGRDGVGADEMWKRRHATKITLRGLNPTNPMG